MTRRARCPALPCAADGQEDAELVSQCSELPAGALGGFNRSSQHVYFGGAMGGAALSAGDREGIGDQIGAQVIGRRPADDLTRRAAMSMTVTR